MSDFLLELRSEEIPARMQAGARAELEKLFRREMDVAGVAAGEITVFSTPRRLVLIARGLPEATEAVSEELKGPPVGAPDAALDGFCRKAGVDKADLEIRDVKGRETYFAVKNIPGRATKELLADAIPAIVRDFSWPKSMRWGDASISTESLRWVRPLSGIVALLGDEVVECEVHGVTSGAVTLGHRFHHSGDITIGNAGDYAMKLRAAHVVVDHEERQDLIRSGAAKVASEAGLALVEDEGLVIENAGLTEWPIPLLGRFEEDYLEVPPEVIQLTARVNQKYFVCETPLPPAGGAGGGPQTHDETSPTPNPSREREGNNLANAFICTANIEAEDGGARVVDGNRKVLAARLSDARFFWEVDRKKTLAEHAKGLERITFHEKLGTVADKVDRVAKLARWLVEEGIVTDTPLPQAGGAGGGPRNDSGSAPTPNPSRRRKGNLADMAEQAALLAKVDLVTEMVGEFPELQGLMGGYYARAEGLPDEVADAIRDHYKPVGQGDEVPTAPVTVAVSLADKLDTLYSFFFIENGPTGSKDPFALRRTGIASIELILKNKLRISFTEFYTDYFLNLIGKSLPSHIIEKLTRIDEELRENERVYSFIKKLPGSDKFIEGIRGNQFEIRNDVSNALGELQSYSYKISLLVFDFLADRLKVQQREAGVSHDLIDAVFALGGEDDLVRLLARVTALQNYIETEDGANLLAGYKRAANILKKEDWHGAEGEIARTGEEDPLALVDDPDMKAVIDAKMSERHEKELSYTPEPAEKALMDALATSEPAAARAIEAEDFGAAMAALAQLRAPIDRFFTEVTVNADEQNKRAARLDLLARFRAAVHKVADFSRIEG